MDIERENLVFSYGETEFECSEESFSKIKKNFAFFRLIKNPMRGLVLKKKLPLNILHSQGFLSRA